MKLDQKSAVLTTFWTPYGRYKYLRMPFGISSVLEEFQRRMHEVCQGLDGVAVIADDILVYGCGDTEDEYMKDHDASLKALLKRARETNLKLNRKKLKLRLSEVVYMGHRLTAKGVQPDPAKVKAIVEMPSPQSKKAVERFLGYVTYHSRFLPQLAEMVQPIRQLTEKNVEFMWQTQQGSALDRVKKCLTLRYYDVKEEAIIQCDASQRDLELPCYKKGNQWHLHQEVYP